MPPTTPLPEADKPKATREATRYLEPEKQKQNVAFNDQSTGAPSTVEVETEKKDVIVEDSGTATDEEAAVAPSALQDSGDHTTGVKLVFILIALVLSIFLFSLDQVSSTARSSRVLVSC
jgi:thiol:disulfide interchange protein